MNLAKQQMDGACGLFSFIPENKLNQGDRKILRKPATYYYGGKLGRL